MAFFVIAYPAIDEPKLKQIEKFRNRNDELNRDVVKAHFTLVFAVEGLTQNTLVSHVKKQAEKFQRISFVLKDAKVVADAFSDYWHVFLVPGKGYRKIKDVHDS